MEKKKIILDLKFKVFLENDNRVCTVVKINNVSTHCLYTPMDVIPAGLNSIIENELKVLYADVTKYLATSEQLPETYTDNPMPPVKPPKEMPIYQCENCKYGEPGGYPLTHCRRHAPIYKKDASPVFPLVNISNWCGDWELEGK